jgi:DNA-3-methyladenine glycosylase I
MKPLQRCDWPKNELAIAYHDREWGVPVHDDRVFFEFLTLEGAQAGLSWDTILRKREAYRKAFAGFDPHKIARFTEARCQRVLQDPGIVRNRAKVYGTVTNARAFASVQDAFGSFDAYVWRFVDGKPVRKRRRTTADIPASTPQSDALSKDLRARGFTFVGTTICYSFMQAVGLVDDHLDKCFKHRP